MKWKKQVASLCLMLAMTVGMSAVSYAQFPFHLMIGSAAPVTLSGQQGYQLALEQAVVKHTSRTTSLLSLPQNEALEQQEQPHFTLETLCIFRCRRRAARSSTRRRAAPLTGSLSRADLTQGQWRRFAGQMRMAH